MSDTSGAAAPPGFMNMIGDTVGLPGLLSSGAIVGSKIPGLLARYGSSALGSLAGGPLTAGLTAAQVMSPTPANQGEQPFYIRTSAGKIVPNPANPIVRERMQAQTQPAMQTAPAAPAQVPGSAPVLPAGFSGAPPQAPAAGGIGSDHSSTPWQSAMPAPQMLPANPGMPAQPAAAMTAPPPNLYNGPGSSSFGAGDSAPGAGSPNANLNSFLQQFLKGGAGQNAMASAQPAAPAAGPYGTASSDNLSAVGSALQKLFAPSSQTGVVGGAGSMSVPTFGTDGGFLSGLFK
jgi:hypothetical protein